MDARCLEHLFTEDEKRRFESDGYFTVEDALPQSLVEDLVPDVDRVNKVERPRVSLKIAYFLTDTRKEGSGNFYVLLGSHLKDDFPGSGRKEPFRVASPSASRQARPYSLIAASGIQPAQTTGLHRVACYFTDTLTAGCGRVTICS